jgi:lysophospholipase L1-like esterase
VKYALLALTLFAVGCGGGGSAPGPLPIIPQAVATAAPANAPLSLVAIGDSITAGYYQTNVGWTKSATLSYPATVASLLNTTTLDNQGIYQERTDQMLADEVPNVPASATVIIVNAGTNDVDQAYPALADATRLDRLVTALHAVAPNAHFVFVTLRNFGNGSFLAGVQAWNAHERALAASMSAPVVDLETDPQWYLTGEWPDNVHPSQQGAVHLGTAVAAAI